MNTRIFFKEQGVEPVVFRGILDELTTEQKNRPIIRAFEEHAPILIKTSAECEIECLRSAKEDRITIVNFEETTDPETTDMEFGNFLTYAEKHNSRFCIKTGHGKLKINTFASSSQYILTLDTLDWIPAGYSFPDSDKYELHLRPDQLLSDLPAGVSVKCLIAKGNKSKSLPENLSCHILAIGDSCVEVLPQSLRCQHVFAGKSALRRVEAAEIQILLNANGCKYPIKFSPNFSCKMLSLENSGVRHLPRHLPTCKALMLAGSQIEELPEELDLDVLSIDYCFKCKTIPDDTKTKSVYMDYSGITHIGNNVTIGKNVDLSHTKVEYIGRNCHTDTIIFSGYITEMPKNLQAKKIDRGAARLHKGGGSLYATPSVIPKEGARP